MRVNLSTLLSYNTLQNSLSPPQMIFPSMRQTATEGANYQHPEAYVTLKSRIPDKT